MAAPSLPTINIRPEVLFGNCIVPWFQAGEGTSSITLTCTGPGGSTANIASAPNLPDSYTFSNLTPGEQYTVSIQANNEFGSSEIQNYKTVTVGSLPNQPPNLSGAIDGTDVVLQWNYPSSNFSPIGWYGIKAENTNYLSNVLGHISTHRVFGLAGSNYTYNVSAINDAGWSIPASVSVLNLFQPESISNLMLLWHDAGTISGTTGTSVPTWTSRVNSRVAVSIETTHPTLKNNGLNGYNTVVYNTSCWHENAGLNLNGNYTFISMSRLTGGANNRVFGDRYDNIAIGYWLNNQDVLYLDNRPGNLFVSTATTAWNLYSLSISPTTAYTFNNFGQTVFSGESCDGTLNNLSYNGVSPDYFDFSDCEIAESYIFTPQLSLSNQQKMEGILAWKYGLQARLPASHPYKNMPPLA
jgi:hypothetical protein